MSSSFLSMVLGAGPDSYRDEPAQNFHKSKKPQLSEENQGLIS